ncbi:MAG: ATPase [Proteobacteria bacterium]|nr:ATPase [Pseudomonadota bacterium]
MQSALGIDAGTTGTRWKLVDRSGAEIGRGEAEPLSGLIIEAGNQHVALDAAARLCQAVIRHGRPALAVAGVTGLSTGSPAADLLQSALAAGLDVPSAAIRVVDDMHICYRGAFAPGEGIVVYAGTGSIAYHLSSDLRVMRAGGHGYLIDDAGGGFWIGREALKHLLRARDAGGDRSHSILASEIAARIGGDSWAETRAFIYGGGRAAVASLVPAIAGAADAGDGAALAILESAGRELARLASVLIDRLGERPIALTGGVARAGPILHRSFRAELPSHLDIRHHTLPPVDAAAGLALELMCEPER